MGVNRYKEHMVVLLEDKPYREIINGIQILSNIKSNVFDIKNPCGGWDKVFESLKNNIHLLEKYEACNILLLMDFDDKTSDGLDFFNQKMEKFQNLVPTQYANRVFLLGVNHKESESLKKFFNKSNFEDIGKLLVEDCPANNSRWDNIHLQCNSAEINRMQRLGVYKWLFQ